nr:IP16954p [Drosophila melanogaster]
MKVYKNASPISPQGMVQVCSTCNEKHSGLAEGGPPPASSSIHSAVGGGSPSAGHSLESNSAMYSTSGAITGNSGAQFGGRNSPSEKSLANSDSMSNVRFRVRNSPITGRTIGSELEFFSSLK